MKKRIDFLKLLISIVICEGVGVLGAFFTTPAIEGWYATLARPALSPPNWVFGPVWTMLFALMGVAAYLVWQQGFKKKEVKRALIVFDVQLALNFFWSILFFGLGRPDLAFLDLIILWIAILASIILFSKISKPAAWLLVPYIAWVTFAGYLNLMIWLIN